MPIVAEDGTSTIGLRGVQLHSEPLPESPFASKQQRSNSLTFSSEEMHIPPPTPPTPSTSPPSPSPSPTSKPVLRNTPALSAEDSELSVGSQRQVSWNVTLSTVREYEVSETLTQGSDDWEDRALFNCKCCCSMQ